MAVWMECKKLIQKLAFTVTDGFNLVERFVEILEPEDLDFVTSLARRIWMRRNTFIFEGVFTSPIMLHQQDIASMKDLHP
jgi:hypothetical protein